MSFPETGTLEIVDVDNNVILIDYGGKNVNQFLNVDPVTNTLNEKTDVRLNDYAFMHMLVLELMKK